MKTIFLMAALFSYVPISAMETIQNGRETIHFLNTGGQLTIVIENADRTVSGLFDLKTGQLHVGCAKKRQRDGLKKREVVEKTPSDFDIFCLKQEIEKMKTKRAEFFDKK